MREGTVKVLVAVADVENDRTHVTRDLRFQTVAVLGAANSGEHGPAVLREPQGARLTDPSRCSGDKCIRHDLLLHQEATRGKG